MTTLDEATTLLEKREIQGNVLHSYGFPNALHLFFSIEQVSCARAFLATLEVMSAARWPEGHKPDLALNVAFSHSGLQKLCHTQTAGRKTAPFTTALFDEMRTKFHAFGQGMRQRQEVLGDSPEHGADEYATKEPSVWDADVWISIHGKSKAIIDQRAATLTDPKGLKSGLRLVSRRETNALGPHGERREHFGFRDEISNPQIEGAYEPGEPAPALNLGNGKRDANGKLLPIRAGEFLLGYKDESEDLFDEGELARFVRNGTFAVVRILEQDVPVFRAFLKQTASLLGRSAEEVGTLIVGRSPAGPAPTGRNPADMNDFGYEDDRYGARCPLAAHVRRVHPRDSSGIVDVTHRLLRRGMPYGSELPEGKTDEEKRGLFFVAFNASIERQFEFVQGNWVHGSTGTGFNDDHDPLLGPGNSSMIFPGAKQGQLPVVVRLKKFVELRGGGYFFMPSLSALAALAEDVGGGK